MSTSRQGRGEARVSITYSTSIFISNSLLVGPPCSFLVYNCVTLAPRQDVKREMWDSFGIFLSLALHSGAERFSYKHLSCITATLPVITYGLHFLPWLSVILNKHQHNNEWKLNAQLRVVVEVTVRMFLIPIKISCCVLTGHYFISYDPTYCNK